MKPAAQMHDQPKHNLREETSWEGRRGDDGEDGSVRNSLFCLEDRAGHGREGALVMLIPSTPRGRRPRRWQQLMMAPLVWNSG